MTSQCENYAQQDRHAFTVPGVEDTRGMSCQRVGGSKATLQVTNSLGPGDLE